MKFLTEVENNKKLVVKHIDGGIGVFKKLDSLGIRKGVVIQKITPLEFKGPVVIEFINSRTQLAIGYGIAKKILVSEVK